MKVYVCANATCLSVWGDQPIRCPRCQQSGLLIVCVERDVLDIDNFGGTVGSAVDLEERERPDVVRSMEAANSGQVLGATPLSEAPTPQMVNPEPAQINAELEEARVLDEEKRSRK